ncbi:hypothetical protein [Mycoplasmoides alvi]|uniref:hypothetical protein n=1 Tax=Mycoplasmoides alvi TaxID=78580 RepID=UPI00051BE2B6|nr:hypothetical protein [Mycoplasmoides alvi]
MLSNSYSFNHLLEYKKNYLRSFIEENDKSFNYFLNEYISPRCIYLSTDLKNNFALGLMTIPKTIVSNNHFLKACLIYGVVAADEYKHTHILHKLFPNFIYEMKNKYDVILIESDYWKIYEEFDLLSLNNFSTYKSVNHINDAFLKTLLKPLNDVTINKALMIFKNQIKNFKISNYVDLDFNTLKHFFKVNILMGDQILLAKQAFALYSKKNKTISAIHFENHAALIELIKFIPINWTFNLDDVFNHLVTINSVKLLTVIKTKMFNFSERLNTIFFSEFN